MTATATKLAPFSINMFKNNSDKVMFSKSKEVKVKADYFSLDEKNQKSIVGIDAVTKDGMSYIAIQVTDQSTTPNGYFRGALFKNDRKTADNQPDLTGSLDLHNQGETPDRLRAAAWSKQKEGGKAGVYLSVAFSLPQAPAQAPEGSANAPADQLPVPTADSDLPF